LLIAERYSPLAAFGRMAGKQELIISDKQQELFVSNLTIQDGHVRIGAEGLARFVASQNPFAIKNWSGVTADSVNQKLSVISVKPSPMVSLDARLNHDLEGPVHDITRAKQSLGRVAPQAYTALADTYRKPR